MATTTGRHQHPHCPKSTNRRRHRIPPSTSAAHHDVTDRHPSATFAVAPVDVDDVAVPVDADLDFLDDDDFGVPINVHDDDLLNFDDVDDCDDDDDDVYRYDTDANSESNSNSNSITTLTPPSPSSPAVPSSLPAVYIPRTTNTTSASYRPPRKRVHTHTQTKAQTQDASFLTNGAATATNATTASMSTGGSSSIIGGSGSGGVPVQVGEAAVNGADAAVPGDVDEPASLPLFHRLPDRHEMHFHFQQLHIHHNHHQLQHNAYLHPHHPQQHQQQHTKNSSSNTIHPPPRHPKPSCNPGSHTIATATADTPADDDADADVDADANVDADDVHCLLPVAARALADVLRGARSDDASQQQHHSHSRFPSHAYSSSASGSSDCAKRLHRSVDLDLDLDRDLLHRDSGISLPSSSPRLPQRTRTWTRARCPPSRNSLPATEPPAASTSSSSPSKRNAAFETDVDMETAWDAFINAMADCGPLARPDHRTVLIALMRATRHILGIRTLIPWYSDVAVSPSGSSSAGGGRSNKSAVALPAGSGEGLKKLGAAAVAAASSDPQQTVSDAAASVVFLQGLGAPSAVCEGVVDGGAVVASPCDKLTAATTTASVIAPATAAEAHVYYDDDAASEWGDSMSTASGANATISMTTRLTNARFLKRFLFALSPSSSSTQKPGSAALTAPPAFDHSFDGRRHSQSHLSDHVSKPRCAPYYRQRRNEVNMNVHLSFALTVVAVHAALARVGCDVTLLTPYAATSAAVSHIPAATAGGSVAADSSCLGSGRAGVSSAGGIMGNSTASFLDVGSGGSAASAAVSGQPRLSLWHRRDERDTGGSDKYSRQYHRRSKHRELKRQRHNNDCCPTPQPQSRHRDAHQDMMPAHGQHILPEMGAVTDASFNARTTYRGAKMAFIVAFEHDAPCRVTFHHPGILAVRNAARFAEVVAEVRRLVESFERSVRAWECGRRAVVAASASTAQADANHRVRH